MGDKVKEGSRSSDARGREGTAPAPRRRPRAPCRGSPPRRPRTSRPRSRRRSRPRRLRRTRRAAGIARRLAPGRHRARRPPTPSPACAAWRASWAWTSRAIRGTGRKGRITKEDVQKPQPRGGGRAGAPPPRPVDRGRRPGPRPVAEGQLRALRRDRAPAADPDPEDQRPEPGPQLGDDPARHAPRRGGHHRAGGVPQAHQRRAVRGQGDDGRAAGEGRRGVAEGVPGRQLARSTATTWCSSATTTSASRPTRRTGSSSR